MKRNGVHEYKKKAHFIIILSKHTFVHMQVEYTYLLKIKNGILV